MPGSFCHNVTHCVWNILEARDDVIISKKESDFHLAASKSTERSIQGINLHVGFSHREWKHVEYRNQGSLNQHFKFRV